MLALTAGDVELLKRLINEGNSVDDADEEGRTALHFACGYGEIECAKVHVAAQRSLKICAAQRTQHATLSCLVWPWQAQWQAPGLVAARARPRMGATGSGKGPSIFALQPLHPHCRPHYHIVHLSFTWEEMRSLFLNDASGFPTPGGVYTQPPLLVSLLVPCAHAFCVLLPVKGAD